jgi:hypothetical protein
MARKFPTLAIATCALAGLHLSPSVAANSATVTVKGTVGSACHLGDLSNGQIDVGQLSNSSDGTLASIGGTPGTTITGSWCNTGSKISIVAAPLVAQSFAGTPPSGFTKAVNYTASATGWGSATASDTTLGNSSGAESSSHSGSQTLNDPEANTITVNLSAFSTPSAGDRLVADGDYEGTITVTLATNAVSPP